MNFCINCKHCVTRFSADEKDYYCRMSCSPRYDHITGKKITHTFTECIAVRNNNSICEYFEQDKWYKIILRKLF